MSALGELQLALTGKGCPQCGSRRLRIHAGQFAPPNHTFNVWRVTCANGHWLEPEGEMNVTTDTEVLMALWDEYSELMPDQLYAQVKQALGIREFHGEI